MIAWFMDTRLGKLVAALVVAAGFLLGAVRYGKNAERDDREVEDMKSYIKTTEEINDVEVSPTRDAAVERLRDNGWVR